MKREVMDHPAETAALVVMTVALIRLWARRERPISLRPGRGGGYRPRLIAPIGLMAAICLLMLAGCNLLPRPVVEVAPNPATFGRQYSDDLTLAGEKIAREKCVSCHAVRPGRQTGVAPPLSTLLAHRSSDQLTDDLVAGLAMDHGQMPVFDFNLVAALSLVAYLETLDAAAGASK